MNKTTLTVNTGSSSIKLDLFRFDATNERVLEASATGIGLPGGVVNVRILPREVQTQKLAIADHAAAADVLLAQLAKSTAMDNIAAIGHRVVHGGPTHSQPQLITDTVEQELQSFAAYDPQHAPAALRLIRLLRQRFPDVPQVACFDTTFSYDMPRVAQLLALPRKYEAIGLRRYGFHGLSYAYLLQAFRVAAGDAAANGRVILAHLGSGASLMATRGGKAIDTTMGFTPVSGVVMSSRAGDLDPGILGYLHEQTGMSIEQYNHMINFESGLLGVSELSADMRTLLDHETTNPQAAEAVNLFVYQVKKAIGALATTLGGMDSLIFSGGIGEQSSILRARIAEGLDFLGIELAPASNERHAELISAPGSQVGVHVLPTDEARTISQQVMQTLNGHAAPHE